MKIAPLAQVKDQLSAYIVESQKSPVIITKNGKPVAVLSGLNGEDDLDAIVLEHNPKLARLLARARAQVQRTGGIPHAEFWKRVRKRRARK